MPDLTHEYTPYGAARELFAIGPDATEVLLAGPAGTGKSLAALQFVHASALMNPGMRGLIVRKTLTSLGSTGLVTWREKVVPEATAVGLVRFYGGSPARAAAYLYKNGSEILVGGMDRAEKIMSADLDLIFVQECTELTINDYEALTTRLRHGAISTQRVVSDANPAHPEHWLKRRCDTGRARMLHSRHEDNPTLFDQETGELTPHGRSYIAKLDALTGVRYQRLRLGNWVASEGVVYDGWSEGVHLIDRFDIPDSWTRWITVDFGYVHPFVAQWWAEDPDGRLYLYREIYHTKRLVEDHAKTMLAAVRDADGNWLEPRPRAVICDHDAEGRATLQRHLGMPTKPAKKQVLEGIQAVQSRLKPAGDGRPRLFILRDSVIEKDAELDAARLPTCTQEEIPGYVWDTGGGKKLKEAPVKEQDDGCDAMRYIVADRDLGVRANIRHL